MYQRGAVNDESEEDFLSPHHDPNKKTQTSDGCSSLHMATRKGHLECVKELLELARKFFMDSQIRLRANPLPKKHENLISLATRLGHWEIVELLCDLYKDASAEEAGFALHVACDSNELKFVELLAKRLPQLVNSYLSGRTRCDADTGDAPINIAVRKDKSLEKMKLLIEAGADVNHISYLGRTPLYEAIMQIDMEKILLLFNGGADPAVAGKMRGCDENQILEAAVFVPGESLQLVKLFADSAPQEHGANAVIQAALHGKYDCLIHLLEKGFPMFDPNDNKIYVWRSMLSTGSLERDSSAIVELLLQHGADFCELLQMLDFGALLENQACRCGGRNIPFSLGQMDENTLKVFLNHGLVEMKYASIGWPIFDHFADNFSHLIYHFIFSNSPVHRRMAYNFLLYVDYFPFGIFRKSDETVVPDEDDDSEFDDSFRNFTKDGLNNVNLEFIVGDVVQKLPKLKQLCRWQIRCTMLHAQGSKMASNVEKLPLPNLLKGYLMYK